MPIEQGRWKNIERENRKCELCENNEIGDEYHYILNCRYFKEVRNKYVKKRFTVRPNAITFKELMGTKNKINLVNLCKFIRIINLNVCPPG